MANADEERNAELVKISAAIDTLTTALNGIAAKLDTLSNPQASPQNTSLNRRDWFAGLAMEARLSRIRPWVGTADEKNCLAIADAMIDALK